MSTEAFFSSKYSTEHLTDGKKAGCAVLKFLENASERLAS